ncbi:MAG: DNA topoisomerase subunit B [Patescibacteria group bacterium]
MAKKDQSSSYTAKDIYVLDGLEPVRRRPGMYIGSTGTEGLHHLIWECVDNSIDEAVMGYADKITITILPQNRIEVDDNGRGIPVEKHSQTKKSALETVMTKLHAGAKFGSKVYKATGGLHGVGVSVVCALSSWMRVEVCRDGKKYFQEYLRGKVRDDVKSLGKCSERGTKVIFEPDQEIFKKIEFSLGKVFHHVREQAYLTPGVTFKIVDKTGESEKIYNFYFERGVRSLLEYLAEDEKPIQESVFYAKKEVEFVPPNAKKGETDKILVEIAFCYTDNIECEELSFVNNIHTREGGTHLTGFHSALTRVLQNWGRQNKVISEKEKIEGEDTREGLVAVISIKIPDPQFEGQTKRRLGNPEARSVVENIVSSTLPDFLEKNPRGGRTIIQKCMLAAKSREAAKAAKDSVLRKGIMEGLALPGKLADCSSRSPEESELFIVEGESAGGSSKQGRSRRFQAILPLKGKILNVERVHLHRILSSKEIRSLIIAMGTAIADDFDISKLRYHKIVIMTDADTDGAHIRTLLLTLFFRHFRQVIDKGYLYIAQPPLYRIQSGKVFKYAYNEEEKNKVVKEFAGKSFSIQRYKGLGEMNPDQLWETTMDPEKRTLKQVTVADGHQAESIFDVLMGSEVFPRKQFIQSYAKEVKNLDV